ncbi:MAG: hypothetical protein L3K02_03375 [Thermoplasmata archaeon]|nr:hypothetical protein [Thermoplasmata archaeon]
MKWSRRKRVFVVLVTSAVTIIAVVTLVLLTVPIAQEETGYTLIGFRLYSFESLSVYGPSPINFSFNEVSFAFSGWCGPVSTGGGQFCGNASELNGMRFPFSISDAGLPGGPIAWQTWVSPDSREAIQLANTGLAHLLVST